MMDEEANRKKEKTDELASALLGVDKSKIRAQAEKLFDVFKKDDDGHSFRIAICGGAGSGKSTMAEALGKLMNLPVIDLDLLVEKGWTADRAEYERRLELSWQKVWKKLPSSGGWIVEHVESCHPSFRHKFAPNWAILLNPGINHLKDVASARNIVGEQSGIRYKRALDSAIRAKQQFGEARGKVVFEETGHVAVKKLVA